MPTKNAIRLMKPLVLATLLTACASGGVDRCAGWKKFTFNDDELVILSAPGAEPLARALLAHNLFGRSLGCW